jgi:hypothetical protein
MTSKISYKTALTANIPFKLNPHAKEYVSLKPNHTFWEDASFKEDVPDAKHNNEWEKKQYAALQRLKKSPTFQRKFATFAENILCVTDTDTEKGHTVLARQAQ